METSCVSGKLDIRIHRRRHKNTSACRVPYTCFDRIYTDFNATSFQHGRRENGRMLDHKLPFSLVLTERTNTLRGVTYHPTTLNSTFTRYRCSRMLHIDERQF